MWNAIEAHGGLEMMLGSGLFMGLGAVFMLAFFALPFVVLGLTIALAAPPSQDRPENQSPREGVKEV
jgi:uncharacterized membrane protein